MSYTAAIIIANRTEAELTVFVEPGTHIVRLSAGAKVRVIAEGDRAGEFDVDHSGDYVTVSAWPNAIARYELEGGQVETGDQLPGQLVARATPGQRPPTFVSTILVGDNEVRVEAGRNLDAGALRTLGARRNFLSRSTWTFPARDEQALASLLHELRDLGVVFAWEPSGWPPAAVFAHLRDRGVVQGTIRAITWRTPDDFQIFEM